MKTVLLKLRGRFVKKIRIDDLVSISNWSNNEFMVWFWVDRSCKEQIGLVCDHLEIMEH